MSARDDPTPLLLAGEVRPPIPIRPIRPRRFRGLEVTFALVSLARRSLLLSVRGKATPEVLGAMVRDTVLALGGLWVKFAQILSSSYAVFPAGFRHPLLELHHASPGFPPEIARRIVEEELGAPIDREFLSFEDQPFAAGSIAQVHRAVLREGRRAVVVKVLRPDAEDVFALDLRLLSLLARLASVLPRFRVLRLRELGGGLARMLAEEVDLRRESAHLRSLRRPLRAHRIRVPRTWRRLARRRILVCEEIHGVFLSDFIRVVEHEPHRALAWARENGIRPGKLARRLFLTHLRQALEEINFHADPNPAEIVLQRNGKVAFIDFGAVGTFDQHEQTTYSRWYRSIAVREYRDAVDRFMKLVEPVPPIDLDAFREQLIRTLRTWDADTRHRYLPHERRSLVGMAALLAQVTQGYGVGLDWRFVLLDRSRLSIDLAMRYLNPRADYHRELNRYFAEARVRSRAVKKASEAVMVLATATDSEQRISDLGGNLRDILRRNALQFRATSSKLAGVVEILSTRVRFATTLAGVFLAVVFVHQRWLHFPIERTTARLDDLIGLLPPLGGTEWLAIGLLWFLVHRAAANVHRRMTRAEARPHTVVVG